MEQQELVQAEPSEDVACWMKEMGRRRLPCLISRTRYMRAASLPDAEPGAALRRSLYMGLLAVAYMQFFFADVFLQIARLPAVVVFVLTGNFPS